MSLIALGCHIKSVKLLGVPKSQDYLTKYVVISNESSYLGWKTFHFSYNVTKMHF